ncbi:MAG: hypothetical protein IPL43_07140 [Micropruina sp.]|nr:hypothetical protein [Micropruina sp.]
MRVQRIALAVGAAVLALAAGAGTAQAQGVTGMAFYVDGVGYRTVATPTDLSNTPAPAHSWDTIYAFGGYQPNVATAAPGDSDYNGGRWQVRALGFPDGYAAALASGDANGNGVLDADAELAQAMADGTAVDNGVVRSFVCPVIPLPGR